MEGIDIVETISGTVENIVYRNDLNDYTVLEIVDKDNSLITAVGIISQIGEGEIVNLQGSWTYHKDFGKQFSFVSYEKSLPKEVDGIIQYLSSRTVKGVGPVTALKIVNKFGAETFDVMENHPDWLTDIPGITMKKAATISKSFKEQSELRNIIMFFKDFMGTGEIHRVYKKMGASAVGVVKENPYILCSGDYAIPFEKADKIAAYLGFSPENDARILSGFEYILKYNGDVNGHTCLPKEKLIEATSAILQISEEIVRTKLEEFIKYQDLIDYKAENVVFVMTKEVAESENYIAKKMHILANSIEHISSSDIATLIEGLEKRIGIEYANLQRLALFKCMESGITVLTGGPGTGKTTVIKAMIAIFKNLGLKTVLTAPTGRAAKRMSEATSEEAKTIHRLLEMERTDFEKSRFNRNASNPLEEKVVIVDEASMIDLNLMDALVHALTRGTRLILIGDSDQLPSVGAGNVLFDIISSNAFNTVRLTEIFRQSRESLIVSNAHKINKGEQPVLNITDNDFFFVRRENEREIADTISNLITTRLPKTYGESIKDEIQVVTPSKKGFGGVDTLNKELQMKINPQSKFKKEKLAHGTVFREGDRVMQTINNYDIEWERGSLTGLGIFNGDIGVIESIDLKEEILEIRFDDRLVKYGFDILDELELSYAITVHKSQGSEYPVVIIPMYSCAPMLMTRNLLYTAVTRARKMVILVGRSDIPSRMVKNNREVLRYTTLIQRLKSN